MAAPSLAKEEVPAEKEVVQGDVAPGLADPDIVEVDPASLDVLAGVALRAAEGGKGEQLDHGRPRPPERGFFERLRGDLPDDVVEQRLGDAAEAAAEHDLARSHRVVARGLAVDDGGDLAGEGLVRLARARVRKMRGLEGVDLVGREERELPQVDRHHGVLGVHEELVEPVGACLLRVEPDGTALGLAEFRAVGLGDQGEGQAPRRHPQLLADQVGARRDVAPLVGAADLELAAAGPAQVVEVMGLEHHVAELRVADAALALHPGAHALLGHHHVHGKVLSDVAQEIEVAHAGRPRGVVHHPRGIGLGVEVEDPGELRLDAGEVPVELLAREEVALGGLSRRVADHPRRPARQGDGMVAHELEPPECQLSHEAADVKGVARRVESAVERQRARRRAPGQRVKVGAVGDEAAPAQLFDDRHWGTPKKPSRGPRGKGFWRSQGGRRKKRFAMGMAPGQAAPSTRSLRQGAATDPVHMQTHLPPCQ